MTLTTSTIAQGEVGNRYKCRLSLLTYRYEDYTSVFGRYRYIMLGYGTSTTYLIRHSDEMLHHLSPLYKGSLYNR